MTDFEQKLNEVSPHERLVLQVLSLFWEPVKTSTFFNLLRAVEIKTPEGRLYQMASVALLRKNLIQAGLLVEKQAVFGSNVQISSPELLQLLTRETLSQHWLAEVVEIIRSQFKLDAFAGWVSDSVAYNYRLLRDYRLSIYMHDLDRLGKISRVIEQKFLQVQAYEVLFQIFSNPFQKEFILSFDKEFQVQVLSQLFDDAIDNSKSTAQLWEFVKENKIVSDEIDSFRLDELIFKGDISAAKKLIGVPDSSHKMFAGGVIALLEKDFETSVLHFESAIKIWKKIYRKNKGYPGVWQMFLYGLALYKTDEARFYKFADEFSIYADKNYPDIFTPRAVAALQNFLRNNSGRAVSLADQMGAVTTSDRIVECLLRTLIPKLKLPDYAGEFAELNQSLGYRWIELEVCNLLALKESVENNQTKHAPNSLQNELGFEPLGNLIPPVEDWERALKSLTVVAEGIQGNTETKGKVDETRIAWQLDFDHKEIQPVEQKYRKTGWSAGRNIALKRLFGNDVKNMTDQDRAVVKSSLRRHRDYSYYGSDYFVFEWQKALAELVGHPNLFSSRNADVNIQLVKGEPSLVVKESGDDLELSFDTKFTEVGYLIQKETETRFKVIEITRQHVDIANSLHNGRLKIPARGREALLKAILPLSTKIAIQSDLEEHFENLPSVDAENRIHALFTPINEGFHLEFFVKPFGTVPPYFKPGRGNESVINEIDGIRTRTKRDLKNERNLLNEIEATCPFLAEFESQNYEWILSDAESCLTALTEMEMPRKQGKLIVEWPKGQKLNLLGNINFENLSMSVKGSNAWFEISGEVKVNEDLVLSMQELTRLISQNDKNFIELSDGQFIAITEKLRRHLQSLDAVMDGKQRLHNLRSGILEEFSDELQNFKADKAWKAHLAKLKEVQGFVPELPATFEAEFRPYQTDGYFWISRLANWGVGACLADDMGLGKTLMALALLIERAENGAALVVAPVSVCRNWIKEAERFAPTLNFRIFGDGDRKAAVRGLGKYDVLVTSYNLLQTEEELFTNFKFATIVLDEAQAIKNRQTKRSKTVMALQADFRLVTTGTPIENHLGELWNLFNFINPGLLGSHEFFQEKFASPIERNNDQNARKTLQRLIKPFILRRRKNQVLDDLPAKTEIMLTVEMSPEERAFYEAIRREALEKIESTEGDTKDKRFRILAELTRLRLACCHPKLVNADIPLGSSKLDLFGETLGELLENKHKALVFSQFVKHLKIVEEYLQGKGITYHYLDGSTPPHVRQERIDAFQRGEGEVFLISLKAGGTGLNLTAADYVIHLDPWWNPAVEDQATDRVHRIGQQRPVTVYRLVTENTVEEKILRLHETKRDLADSLLDGTDSSGTLSADDLLALISETK